MSSNIDIGPAELALTNDRLLQSAIVYLRTLEKYTQKLYKDNHWHESWELMCARKFLESYDTLMVKRKELEDAKSSSLYPTSS